MAQAHRQSRTLTCTVKRRLVPSLVIWRKRRSTVISKEANISWLDGGKGDGLSSPTRGILAPNQQRCCEKPCRYTLCEKQCHKLWISGSSEFEHVSRLQTAYLISWGAIYHHSADFTTSQRYAMLEPPVSAFFPSRSPRSANSHGPSETRRRSVVMTCQVNTPNMNERKQNWHCGLLCAGGRASR